MATEEVFDMDELKKLKVADLRAKLVELGLPSKGTKNELLARLEEYFNAEVDDGLLEDEDVAVEEGDIIEGDNSESANQQPTHTDPSNEEQSNSDANISKSFSITEVKAMSDLERKQAREKKFGAEGEDLKKLARAKRFGLASTTAAPASKRPKATEEELEKMKKRAERFGEVVAPALKMVEDDEKKVKRLERFAGADAEKVKKRQERFSSSS